MLPLQLFIYVSFGVLISRVWKHRHPLPCCNFLTGLALCLRQPEDQSRLPKRACQQIKDPACRLLTLTGPGGIGKSRLSLEVTHRLRGDFDEGVFFVPLAGTSASQFITPAIADSLGFIFSGAADLTLQLNRFIGEKHLLLVLDNLEQLLDGIGVLATLLQHAPNLKLLATSREPLDLRAEWVFEVQGLPVPAQFEVEDLESNSAVALFIQRTKQAQVDFVLSPDDYSALTRVCQLVEGLPLALELAASWVRIMPVQEIGKEIERNLDFLATSARDVPPRHRSIRTVFDSSWRLLLEEECAVMRQLYVFRGGFTRLSAEQVAGATLPVLSALVAKSFVRRQGTRRFDMQELVRQYAASHL